MKNETAELFEELLRNCRSLYDVTPRAQEQLAAFASFLKDHIHHWQLYAAL